MNRTFATLSRARNARRTQSSRDLRARTVRTGPRLKATWRVNPVSGRVELRWFPANPDPDPLQA
jgi:hypothetical protein